MKQDKTKEKISISHNNTDIDRKITNPIDSNNIIVPLDAKTSINRLYSGYNNVIAKKQEINFIKVVEYLNSVTIEQTDLLNLFYETNSVLSSKLNINFCSFGIYNDTSNYIELELIDKTGALYSSKILLNDKNNIITESFLHKKIITSQNSNYLKSAFLNNLSNSPSTIIPLVANSQCLGVFIVSDDKENEYIELYKLIANYFSMFYKNKVLNELVNKNSDTDSLTGLYNYKKLQESLADIMTNANNTDNDFAFCIIDIANISEINNELGHAKGDIIIKEVAKKLKKNIRNTDIIGRYAGDKIAIIMQHADVNNAKYLCEYLLYNLSCSMFDDIGQLKFSCGISMYSLSSNKQDKLILLAEQALIMAKGKRNQTGQSEIIAATDFNFWEDKNLKYFVEVLSKKHTLFGTNVEEELIKQFHNEDLLLNDHIIDVVSSLVNTIDAKDTYTKGHSAAVSRYSEALARACNLPTDEVERIKLGALLHDIGKIGIPEDVLRKPTKLSVEEWNIMKQHPLIGADKVLKPNKSLQDLIPMVKYHHEHIDGSGYPCGLKEDEIPLNAKIVAVADAYHALISDRPYRKGLSVAKACEILKMGAGKNWDRELVRKFITLAPSLATNI